MITEKRYTYDLWNGKVAIGTISLSSPIQGLQVTVSFAPPVLKQVYGKKYEEITCPITLLTIRDDGVEIHIRKVIDVRKKSKRQRLRLLGYSSYYSS